MTHENEFVETTWWTEHAPPLFGLLGVLTLLAGTVWTWLTW